MAFPNNRKSSGPGPNPGLTPIDDIHGRGTTQGHEPDTTTGRLPEQDERTSASPATKRRRDTKKRNGRT